MTAATEANPSLSVDSPGYDASGHQKNVLIHLTNITTDSSVTPNVTYGDLAIAVNNANANGQATMANSAPVVLASDQTPKTTSTATKTNVAAANADTALLSALATRKGALFTNDSSAILYLSYGSGAASATSYTVPVGAGAIFELPPEPIYTGAIHGFWSAANGNVRITELS